MKAMQALLRTMAAFQVFLRPALPRLIDTSRSQPVQTSQGAIKYFSHSGSESIFTRALRELRMSLTQMCRGIGQHYRISEEPQGSSSSRVLAMNSS
ncbi:hypothetical protein N656DRAFT_166885 [Canariomyces notabilis]|uniref:Uncharacterized protein n=1 Tax=Canariomyces notabilis TaxID=2074819 RepID=A0AAN6QJK1_9PEZI|nr:hypothetical protein N656DRAFT_166885 [Canariomyces arenarius]